MYAIHMTWRIQRINGDEQHWMDVSGQKGPVGRTLTDVDGRKMEADGGRMATNGDIDKFVMDGNGQWLWRKAIVTTIVLQSYPRLQALRQWHVEKKK